jgi:hypothetical protein
MVVGSGASACAENKAPLLFPSAEFAQMIIPKKLTASAETYFRLTDAGFS